MTKACIIKMVDKDHPEQAIFVVYQDSSVADPDPGSGAFLTPGLGIPDG
jgi:hypothetical protein